MIIYQYVRFSKQSLNSGPIKHYREDNLLVKKNNIGIFTVPYYDPWSNTISKRLAIIPGLLAFLSRISFYKFLLREIKANAGEVVLLRVSSIDLMLLPTLVRLYKRRIKVIPVYHSIFDDKFIVLSRLYHRICLKYCFGIAAPTQEILNFYNADSKSKNFLLPNGVTIDRKTSLKGKIYSKKVLNIVFIASSNQKWHSLKNIIKAIHDNDSTELMLHIIGNISGINKKNVIFWGQQEGKKLSRLLADMDIGLGSFPSQNFILKETSALKHREYLRYGIPVYTGVYDILADHTSRFLRVGELDTNQIIEFANEVKGVAKNDIRASFQNEIDREKIFNRFVESIVSCQ